MELLEKYFAELIQCIDASYLVIGIILVFLSVPDTADYAPYRKAKYFLASAFFVMFIDLYLWLEIFSSQDWEVLNSINACMDISLFFLTGICFAYSFAFLESSLSGRCVRTHKSHSRPSSSWPILSPDGWKLRRIRLSIRSLHDWK